MIFLDEHSPSTLSKLAMSFGVLSGILLATGLTTGYLTSLNSLFNVNPVENNLDRQILMLVCCLIYFARFTYSSFTYIQRTISWQEGGLVTILFFMMFYYFTLSAGQAVVEIGVLDYIGIILFLVGSWLNVVADSQRYQWKLMPNNKGHLYTNGLFRYSMHMNYFGDAVAYLGLALITHHIGCVAIALGMFVYFISYEIPRLDKYLGEKYPQEFTRYHSTTNKFIPFVY